MSKLRGSLSFGLAALIIGGLVLSGCGGSKPAPAPAPSGGSAPAAAPAPAPGPAPAPKPPLKVGLLTAYSKVYASLGDMKTKGMELYFDQVGWTAGGRKIELIKEDEENDAQVSIRKANKLIEQDKVDLVTGVVSTPIAYALRDVMDAAKMVFIVSNAGGDKLTREMKSPYVFRTSFTSSQVAAPMGEWAAKNLAKEAFVSAADYGFGQESAAAFKTTFEKNGGKVIGSVFPKLGNADYAPYLTQIKDAKPKATYHFYSGSDAVAFVKQWKEFGLKGSIPLTGSGFLLEEDVLKAVGDAAEGGISSLHWAITLDNPENKAFVAAFKKKYNTDPDVFALQGYDTARFIVEGVNKVSGNTSDKQAWIKAMEGIKFNSPRGPFEIDPVSHQVIQNIYIRKVVKGADGVFHNEVIATYEKVKDPPA